MTSVYPTVLDPGIFDRMHVVLSETFPEDTRLSRLQRTVAGISLAFFEGADPVRTGRSFYQDYELFWSDGAVVKDLCLHYLKEQHADIVGEEAIEFFFVQAYRIICDEEEVVILSGIFQGLPPNGMTLHYYTALFATNDVLATEIVMKFA